MGNKLFGIDIAGLINRNVGRGLPEGRLIKRVAGTRTAGAVSAGTNPKEKVYRCRGYREVKQFEVVGTTVRRTVPTVAIIGDSLPAGVFPEANDYVEFEGYRSRITSILQRDPAAALYICEAAD